MKFYGRIKESLLIRQELDTVNTCGRMVVIAGRRQVGKTCLLLDAVTGFDRKFLYFLCRRKYSEKSLAQVWLEEVQRVFGLSAEDGPYRLTLTNVIKFTMKLSVQTHAVLFVDDLEELEKVSENFVRDFLSIWSEEKHSSRLLLTFGVISSDPLRNIAVDELCRSADVFLHLHPFTPQELRNLFLHLNPKGRAEDLLTLYAVTGGVPGYVADMADHTDLTRDSMVHYIFSQKGEEYREAGNRLLRMYRFVERNIKMPGMRIFFWTIYRTIL